MQTLQPILIMVVDNDPKKTASSVVDSFKHILPLKYVFEKRQGAAYGRNKAINICRTRFIGFVDDDCVLDKEWVEQGLKKINKSKATFIVGKSGLFNPSSLVALGQYYNHNQWYQREIRDNRGRPTAFNCDTKNIMLRISDIKKTVLGLMPLLI